MLYVVLPAFNESKSLPDLLAQILDVQWPQDMDYTVVLVDDGSTDGTVRCCDPYRSRITIDVVQHEENRGLGAALATGLRHCLSGCADDDVVVTMDADNTHSPSHVPSMLRAMGRGNDIVIASRYVQGGKEVGLSARRRVLSRGASLVLKAFFPVRGASDYTCGFRAYSASILRRGFRRYGDRLIEETGFVCMTELLVKLASLGARVAEVPLVLRYDRKQGASKVRVGRTVRRYISFIALSRARINARRFPDAA